MTRVNCEAISKMNTQFITRDWHSGSVYGQCDDMVTVSA